MYEWGCSWVYIWLCTSWIPLFMCLRLGVFVSPQECHTEKVWLLIFVVCCIGEPCCVQLYLWSGLTCCSRCAQTESALENHRVLVQSQHWQSSWHSEFVILLSSISNIQPHPVHEPPLLDQTDVLAHCDSPALRVRYVHCVCFQTPAQSQRMMEQVWIETRSRFVRKGNS